MRDRHETNALALPDVPWSPRAPLFAGLSAGVEFWLLWSTCQFSNQPPAGHLAIGMALFFPLATLAICLPKGELRRAFLVLGLLCLVVGWVLHFEVIVNLPPRYAWVRLDWGGVGYIAFLGAPSWLFGLVALLASVDSPRDLPGFLFETSQKTWVKMSGLLLLAGLQMRMFQMLEPMRGPASLGPLSTFLVGFFLTSLVRLHWPRTPGVDVLWRSLTWAVGLVLLSGLCLSQADPRLQGRWTIAGDLFAFLTPVWILRLWFGSMEAIVKNESVSKRMP